MNKNLDDNLKNIIKKYEAYKTKLKEEDYCNEYKKDNIVYIVYYENNKIKNIQFSRPQHVILPYEDSEMEAECFAITFYENGKIKKVEILASIMITTKIEDLIDVFISYDEEGTIKIESHE